MSSRRFAFFAVCAFAAALLPAAASADTKPTFRPTTPALSVEEMSRDWQVWNARISPDGKHIAALAGIPGQNPVVRVWSTDDMSKTPTQFGSRTMRFINVQFLNNSKLLVTANQPVALGANSNWLSKAAIASLDGSSFVALDDGDANVTDPTDPDRILGFALFRRLPKEENHYLVQINRFAGTEIVKVDLRNGQKQKYARSGEDEAFEWADELGNIRLKSELRASGGVWYQHAYYREPGGAWRELPGLKVNLNDRYQLDPVHVSKDGKTVWVITDRDTNYSVLAKYDIATDTISEPVAVNTEFDIQSASFGSSADEDAVDSDPLRTVCWAGPSIECLYNDPIDKRISSLLERAMPGRTVSFNVRNNGANVLVSATAPNQPDTFYLLKNEKQLIRIGSRLDGWDQKNLGPAEWVTYAARDGFPIPGILYLPPGYNKERDGRLPLVVMPHGGPWSRDTMNFDSSYWSQMFATRGFAVLLPQYRGSSALGKALWKGGDKQWGGRMQDDKDDGAKWLVAQGIADPDRMMMYGYSYGGFAAAAAAVRSGTTSKGLWQCAISGAPAIDLERISNDWGESRIQRVIQGVTVDGYDPIEHLKDVEIPWLIFHGSYDRQADTIHSRTTAAKMRSVNPRSDFKYVEIPRMSHQLVQMTPEHKKQFLTLILDWMSEDCGNISKTFKEASFETGAARGNGR